MSVYIDMDTYIYIYVCACVCVCMYTTLPTLKLSVCVCVCWRIHVRLYRHVYNLANVEIEDVRHPALAIAPARKET